MYQREKSRVTGKKDSRVQYTLKTKSAKRSKRINAISDSPTIRMLKGNATQKFSPVPPRFKMVRIKAVRPTANHCLRRKTRARKSRNNVTSVMNRFSKSRPSPSAKKRFGPPKEFGRELTGVRPGMLNQYGKASSAKPESAATVPVSAPAKASRPTSGSQILPESSRVQEISTSGQRRRT